MPATIQRPIFVEGQILGADDLASLLDYARDQEARHARYAHSWGIAHGFELRVLDDKQNLEIQPGLAIDSSGAALILSAAKLVNVDDFRDQISRNEPDGTFPLFIVGRHVRATGRARLGRCAGGSETREQETVEARFDRPATLAGWQAQGQDDPGVAQGPDPGEESGRRVLIGFVRWEAGQFKNVALEQVMGRTVHRPRHLGVHADVVLAHSGRLVLRTRPPGHAEAPLVVIDPKAEDGKRSFTFGLDDGLGGLKPLFWVDKEGNVAAKGTIAGEIAVKPGEVYVQSGKATDGVTLPLPTPVTDDLVRDGIVTLHVMVNPRVEESEEPPTSLTAPPPVQGPWIPRVTACSVDEHRRVSCLIQWFDTKALGNTQVLPGVCEYLIMATVAPKSGGAS